MEKNGIDENACNPWAWLNYSRLSYIELRLVASVPALKGCHTQAKSYDELIERIKEAIELCLEMENQDFEPLEFVAGQRITINSWVIFQQWQEKEWYQLWKKLDSLLLE